MESAQFVTINRPTPQGCEEIKTGPDAEVK